MPKSVTKSPLSGKLDGAIKAHKGDETKRSTGGRLPAGIENGVAILADMKIDLYKEGANKGEPFFYAAGIVKAPKVFTDKDGNKIPIEGQRTTIMEPLCDTPSRSRKTTDEHVAWMLNHIRLLGGDECLEGVDTEEELRNVMKVLVDQKIPFRFRTWSGKKQEIEERDGKFFVVAGGNDVAGPFGSAAAVKVQFPYIGSDPLVNEEWLGATAVEVSEKSEVEEDDLVDNTEEKPKPKPKKEAEPEPEPEPEEEIPFGDGLDDLGAAADTEEDEEAQRKLQELAEEAGIPKKKIEGAENWTEVAAMIREAKGEPEAEDDEEPAEEAAEDWKPTVAEVWYYKPPKKRKAVEVEVTAVFEGKKVCNVKDLETNTTYRSVKWEELKESAE